MIRALLVIAVVVLVGGCESAAPTPSAALVALRTVPYNGNCRGVGAAGVAHGSPDDPAVAWLAGLRDGRRQDVVWPGGDAAVFDPSLRIVDATGRTVIRDGDYVQGGCVTGPDARGPLLIPNPEDAFRLECGPVAPDICPQLMNLIRFETADWPRARVDSLTFTDISGTYVIVLEDGRRIQGEAPALA